VPNSFEENDCENANIRAQGGEHLLVLAHLRRQWSFSGRDGFGTLSPSRRASRWDSCVFVEMKHLFSFASKDGTEGKVT
jgi:lipid-binding SYLF domain-containing protein